MKIDTSKSVKFYDDRGKGDDYHMTEILYQNDDICLCKSDDLFILFSKITGRVLTSNLQFYIAENF